MFFGTIRLAALVQLLCIFWITHAHAADHTQLGPLKVEIDQYDFGDEAFQPSDFRRLTSSPKTELKASVYYPQDLSHGPYPLVLFMHGRHLPCYVPGADWRGADWKDAIALDWPCPKTRLGQSVPVPSHEGYEYAGRLLASYGYIVASVGTNGINAFDNNGIEDKGMQARAELLQEHLKLWRNFNENSTGRFGGRFIGKVNLQKIGIMGHSRGGEGAIFHYLLNESQQRPFGVRAIFLVAPVDFNRFEVNNVTLGTILPYCDGDVSGLQGIHFFDDARYNIGKNDGSWKYYWLVMGGNHNYFNSIWSPSSNLPFSVDDWAYDDPDRQSDPYCGSVPGNQRLSELEQVTILSVYLTAFFRLHLGGEAGLLPLLKGIEMPPAPLAGRVHASFHPPALGNSRKDLNRLDATATLNKNAFGGNVYAYRFSQVDLCGGQSPLPQYCRAFESEDRWPHNATTLRLRPGLTALHLKWDTPDAVLGNELIGNDSDISSFSFLQMRIGLDYTNPKNKSGQDFSIILVDASGNKSQQVASKHTSALFFPPGENREVPKMILNTVQIPLSSFAGVNLNKIKRIELSFSQFPMGELYISDIAFSN